MIAVNVLVDGKKVATSSAPSRFALPDVIALTAAPYLQDPDVVWEGQEQVKDAAGDLIEVRVFYRKQARMPMAA